MKLTALLIFCWVTGSVIGQSILNERRVFASAGREVKNIAFLYSNVYFLTYTIGEPVIHGGGTTYKLANGFIQPNALSASSPPATAGMVLVDDAFKIYPNPFDNHVMIASPDEQSEEVQVQLIDMQGKLIQQERLLSKNHLLEIPESCAPGSYFLNFYRADGTFLQQTKVVKTRLENQGGQLQPVTY